MEQLAPKVVFSSGVEIEIWGQRGSQSMEVRLKTDPNESALVLPSTFTDMVKLSLLVDTAKRSQQMIQNG